MCDKDLQVGDLITAYHPGYHRIIKIEKKDGLRTLVFYKTVLDDNGKERVKSREKNCHVSYCIKVTAETIATECQESISKANELATVVAEELERQSDAVSPC